MINRLGGGGRGLRVLDAKTQGYRQLIEMKLCVSYHNYESTPKERNKSSNSDIYLLKMSLTLKNALYVQNRSSRPN